jgi:hypothetical protein
MALHTENTSDLDKMLESLAPALSAELDRILERTRRQMEEEFRKRMEVAIADAEDAAKSLAEMETEKALSSARTQLSSELRNQFDQTLNQTTAKLQAEFEQRLLAAREEWTAEKVRLEEELNRWRSYAEAQRQMREGGSQVAILTHFLDQAGAFSPNLAVYVVKADGLALWKTRGGGSFPPVVSQNTSDPEAYFKAVVVRDKTVAAVCARQPFHPESLDFLTGCLAHAIEAFGIRLQNRTPKAVASS